MSKKFLCLGAGPIIGFATAVKFASEGFDAILVARNKERLNKLAQEFEKATGKRPETVIADLGQADGIRELPAHLPQVDVLHFNAALKGRLTLEQSSCEDLREFVQVGVTGALYSLKAFAPSMLARKAGTILLTGGALAMEPAKDVIGLAAIWPDGGD